MDLRKERLLGELKRMGIKDRVLEAVRHVDRETFVPEPYRRDAYANYPQPIGHGQTISQPYTVAYMIQLLGLHKGQKVLEIGAGSGYNAAIMSYLVGEEGLIVSVEIVPQLAERAERTLKEAGVENVRVVHGDGKEGYSPEAPYDRVMVTAAARRLPDTLLGQLKEEGIMVIPVSVNGHQVMTRVLKDEPLEITRHGEFRFVPFI